MELTKVEGRVIGSLIEKELTTPQQYPLTLNALLLACNQSSNRDPVVDYDEATVSRALGSLKSAGLVRFAYPSHGRSVTRYEHLLAQQTGMGREQRALVAVLLLRGPQTAAELRMRAERMCQWDDLAAVEAALEGLSRLPEPAVALLGRRPGQKEERWVERLTVTDAGSVEAAAAGVSSTGDGSFSAGAGPGHSEGEHNELAALRRELGELRGAVAELDARVQALYDELH